MGFWAWFWIWIGLFGLSLLTFAFIGRSLFIKSAAVFFQVSKVATKAQSLVDLVGAKAKQPRTDSPDLITPEEAASERLAYLRAKAKKREERQRILIKSLKKYDPKESRFH